MTTKWKGTLSVIMMTDGISVPMFVPLGPPVLCALHYGEETLSHGSLLSLVWLSLTMGAGEGYIYIPLGSLSCILSLALILSPK